MEELLNSLAPSPSDKRREFLCQCIMDDCMQAERGNYVSVNLASGVRAYTKFCNRCYREHNLKNLSSLIPVGAYIIIKVEYKATEYLTKLFPKDLAQLIIEYSDTNIFPFLNIGQIGWSNIESLLERSSKCSMVNVYCYNSTLKDLNIDQKIIDEVRKLVNEMGCTNNSDYKWLDVLYEIWNLLSPYFKDYQNLSADKFRNVLIKYIKDSHKNDEDDDEDDDAYGNSEHTYFEPLPSLVELERLDKQRIKKLNREIEQLKERIKQRRLNAGFKVDRDINFDNDNDNNDDPTSNDGKANDVEDVKSEDDGKNEVDANNII